MLSVFHKVIPPLTAHQTLMYLSLFRYTFVVSYKNGLISFPVYIDQQPFFRKPEFMIGQTTILLWTLDFKSLGKQVRIQEYKLTHVNVIVKWFFFCLFSFY